jgi:hypothetical protein
MKIFITTVTCMLFAGSLLADEPFILKQNNRSSLLKETPTLFSKKETTPILFAKKETKLKMAANSDGKSNIAIKMNLSQIALRNLSFQAEYGFHKKMTVAVGFSYLMKRDLSLLYNVPDSLEKNFTVPKLSGFAITPEFRFYPGGDEDKPAPNGFYIGAYLRYAKYKLAQTVSYTDDTQFNPQTYTAEAKQTYGGINGGLMIGRQWIIADHFTIDWWIIGAGYGKAKYTYEWVAKGANLSEAQQADVKKQADENFDGFSAFGLDASVQTTSNSAKMTVKGVPMMSLRFMGLCLGYAF